MEQSFGQDVFRTASFYDAVGERCSCGLQPARADRPSSAQPLRRQLAALAEDDGEFAVFLRRDLTGAAQAGF
jgi:hypothetical protein